jgi:hypothetical protein
MLTRRVGSHDHMHHMASVQRMRKEPSFPPPPLTLLADWHAVMAQARTPYNRCTGYLMPSSAAG